MNTQAKAPQSGAYPRSIHYWTGRGTLCSLDNNVVQQANHSNEWSEVTCRFCNYQHSLNTCPDCGMAIPNAWHFCPPSSSVSPALEKRHDG